MREPRLEGGGGYIMKGLGARLRRVNVILRRHKRTLRQGMGGCDLVRREPFYFIRSHE